MFIEKIQDKDIKTQNKYSLINALCLCAHEAVNRVRIREAKGLELLLNLLDDEAYKFIHNRLISCLVCFLYDETSFDVLLSNRLVPILLHHLVRIAKLDARDNENMGSKDVDDKEETTEANKIIDELLDGDGKQENKSSKKETSESKSDKGISQQSEEISVSLPVVLKVKNLENPDFKRSQSCPSLPTDDTEDNKSKTFKYSMDSPTYQAISDFDIDNVDDYFSGPKNIVDAQQYFGDSGAGGMSPWSYSSAGVSPYRSPTGSISPYRSPQSSEGGLSPYRSPAQSGPYSPLSVSSLASSHSPDTSPRGSISPQYSVISPGAGSSPGASSSSFANSSPSIRSLTSFSPLGADAQAVPSSQGAQWTPISSPFHLDSPVFLGIGSPMWSSGTTTTTTDDSNEPRYSSEEDDGNLEENVLLSETCVTSLGDGCASVLSTDPLFLDVALTSSADPTFKVPESSARNTPSSSQSPCTFSNKKKRRLSEETKVRIKKSVERSSASAPTSPRVIESIMKQDPTYSKDEYDLNPELPKLKDPIKVTEHNILVLLSRVSYTTNPSAHLVNQPCLSVLLDYVLLATDPFPRCGRILARLTKNYHCFEPLILCLGPSLIQAKLCSYSINQILQQEAKKQTDQHSTSDCTASTSMSSPPAKRLRLDTNIATRTAFR